MDFDDKNQSATGKMECDEQTVLLLSDFIDGILPAEKAEEMCKQIDSSPTCRNLYRLLIQANTLTGKIKAEKMEYIHATDSKDKEAQISRIKQLIRAEQGSAKSSEITKKQPKKKKIALFPSRRWAYASTAAGFVVLIAVFTIFISVKSNFWNTQKSTDTANQASRAYAAAINGYQDTGTAEETQESGTSKSSMAEDSGTKTATHSSDDLTSLSVISGIGREAVDSIRIIPGYSQELLAAMKGSVAFLAIKNDSDSYISILAFPATAISEKMNALDAINQKINQSTLTAKIEIISSENPQKLVEYTSEENAELLQKTAEANSADFLVITIRG